MTDGAVLVSGVQERISVAIERVDHALAAPWWRKHLPAGLQQRFEVSTQDDDRINQRFWLALLLAAQVLGLLRDFTFGMQEAGVLLRAGLVAPLVAFVFVQLGRNPSRMKSEVLTSLAIVIAIAAQIAIGAMSSHIIADRYFMSSVFAFTVLHLVVPLSYRQILLHGILAAVPLFLALLLREQDPAMGTVDWFKVLLPGSILLASLGAIGRLGSRRRAFLMELRSTLQAQALEEANRTLAQLLRQDPLTGVYNRRYFDETMQTLWHRMQCNGRSIGLILLDVDRFKSFNDRCGHRAGDTCLRQVATRLSASLRGSDFVVARYGGEEFAVILPGVFAVDAYGIGERLRQAVEDMAWPHPAGGVVTVSVGTAACVPDENLAHHALMDAADSALYASKEAGRNCGTANFVPREREGRSVTAQILVA